MIIIFTNFFNNWEYKHRVPDTYYKNSDYTNIITFIKDHVEFDTKQVENAKRGKRQRLVFQNNR